MDLLIWFAILAAKIWLGVAVIAIIICAMSDS